MAWSDLASNECPTKKELEDFFTESNFLRYRYGIDSSEEAFFNASVTGMYDHGGKIYKSNGWHGILLVFTTPAYTFRIDLNMSNDGWKIGIFDTYKDEWRYL